MPELPEVETIKNTLAPVLTGATITDAVVRQRHFRQIVPAEFETTLKGASVVLLRRISKYMLIDLDNGFTVIWHFGMSGKFKIESKMPSCLDKHDHIILKTTHGIFIYNDTRRFGLVTLCKTDGISGHPLFKGIGPEPWDERLTAAYLLEKLRGRKTPIKIALLEQDIICGIGNIYASEILYKARILPTRESASLSPEEAELLIKYTREVLEQAIRAGGSTIHDYHRPDGSIGYFQNQHCVYNKTGERCPDCICQKIPIGGIRKITQGGRSTFYCAVLQK